MLQCEFTPGPTRLSRARIEAVLTRRVQGMKRLKQTFDSVCGVLSGSSFFAIILCGHRDRSVGGVSG